MGPKCLQPPTTTSPHTPPSPPPPTPPPPPPPSPSPCPFFRSRKGCTSQGVWKSSHWATLRNPTALIVLLVLGLLRGTQGCTMGNKEVGVCLHRYLERDFLSLERIVYPKRQDWFERNRYAKLQLLPPLPPLPPLPEYDEDYDSSDGTSDSSSSIHKRSPPTTTTEATTKDEAIKDKKPWKGAATAEKEEEEEGEEEEEESSGGRRHLRHYRSARRKREAGKRGDHDRLQVGNLQAGNFGRKGWVEGPELEDYCKRLEEVVLCFKDTLEKCDNSYDFFRYRHLLHSLSKVHVHLCDTPEHRTTRFLAFLGLIECAENARISSKTCHRHNITNNVWNQILRLEVGPELCAALNVQRSCLLEENYISDSCSEEGQEQLYKEVSAIFLATWCKIPGHPHLPHYFASSSRSSVFCTTFPYLISAASILFTLMWRRPYLSDFT